MSATSLAGTAELDAPQTIEPRGRQLSRQRRHRDIQLHRRPRFSTETKSGGTPDPHTATMHNARPHLAEFKLDVHGFRYARHATAMKNFMDADEIKRLLPRDGRTDQPRAAPSASSCSTTRSAPPTTISARSTKSASRCAAPTTTTPNGRGRSGCAISCPRKRTRCSPAASPSSRRGGRSAIRSRRTH